jgi:hypothetical protein
MLSSLNATLSLRRQLRECRARFDGLDLSFFLRGGLDLDLRGRLAVRVEIGVGVEADMASRTWVCDLGVGVQLRASLKTGAAPECDRRIVAR